MHRKGLPDPARPGMSMAATLVDVASRGRITLSSDRPDVAPTIEARYPNDDDPLDLELRVRGIDRLRVVDASAMPAIPRGNTNAPTIALAERAVDLIRGAAAQPRQHTEQIAQFAGGAL